MSKTRDEIFARPNRLRRVTVEVPEWETTLTLRELTARESQELVDQRRNDEELRKSFAETMAETIVRAAIDEDGQHIFRPEDVPRLLEEPFNLLHRLYEPVNEMSRLFKEDAAKNSKATEGGSNCST